LIVKTLDLTREYRRGASVIRAIEQVNLDVEGGTFVSIVGPSGSGKSTLLYLIGLCDRPTSGKVYFKERDSSRLTERELREIRLREIGFVFQTFNLLPTLTARENVELPMAMANVPTGNQSRRAIQLLESLGLGDRVEHRPKELSVGEMQRVAIARALANNPSLIIADEPTGELDSKTGLEIVNLLSSMCKEERTVILATHDERITAMSDVVYRIQDGKLVKCTGC
jgi:putative ABC transport system ATP-binding protein